MFTQIIKWLKGVFKNMFSKEEIKRTLNDEVTLSNSMSEAIELWNKMLEGKAPWTDSDEDGIKSLGLEKAICREFANVVVSEMETSLESEELNSLYQQAIQKINENIQDGLALGGFCLKPIGNTGAFEYIPADRIIPLEFDSKGNYRKVAFVQIKPIGETDVYYRLELHELNEIGLRIANMAFKGTIGNFGQRIPLSSVDEWATLEEDVTYSGMNRMDFGYYKNPIPNRIDRSPNGVSIFNDAVQLIRKADIQFGRLDWEYSSGERLVFADYTTIEKKQDGQGGFKWKAPKGKDRMFVGVNGSDEMWNEHSPSLRDSNFIQGLNEYKREIEFTCSLSYGDLSKNEQVEKTAQEIRASQNRKYNMVNQIQTNLKVCLEDFAYSLAFYNAMFTQDIGFTCNFHDSIKTDEETERAQDRIDMQMGIMSKVAYRMKWYGEDEATAQQKIQEAMIEALANMQVSEGVMN